MTWLIDHPMTSTKDLANALGTPLSEVSHPGWRAARRAAWRVGLCEQIRLQGLESPIRRQWIQMKIGKRVFGVGGLRATPQVIMVSQYWLWDLQVAWSPQASQLPFLSLTTITGCRLPVTMCWVTRLPHHCFGQGLGRWSLTGGLSWPKGQKLSVCSLSRSLSANRDKVVRPSALSCHQLLWLCGCRIYISL